MLIIIIISKFMRLINSSASGNYKYLYTGEYKVIFIIIIHDI